MTINKMLIALALGLALAACSNKEQAADAATDAAANGYRSPGCCRRRCRYGAATADAAQTSADAAAQAADAAATAATEAAAAPTADAADAAADTAEAAKDTAEQAKDAAEEAKK